MTSINLDKKIFFSSAAFTKIPGCKILNYLKKNKIENVELSAGKFYENNINEILKKKEKNLRIHNYFPPPKIPFVINLASTNERIRLKSINFVKKNIRISKHFGNIVSFHAGFLIDPIPKSLGKILINKEMSFNRKKSINIFIKSIKNLSNYAKKYKVTILIENNVLTKKNLNHFNCNPFLMVDAKETIQIMKKTPKNVWLLLDFAHLKVSAKTLNFSKYNYMLKCKKWIKAYHLSDNNSINDSNSTIHSKSWFWKCIFMKNINYLSAEIKTTNLKLIKSQLNLIKKKIKNV